MTIEQDNQNGMVKELELQPREFRTKKLSELKIINNNLRSLSEVFRNSQDKNLATKLDNEYIKRGSIIASILLYQNIYPQESFIEASIWIYHIEEIHAYSKNDVRVKVYDPNHKGGHYYQTDQLDAIRYSGTIGDSIMAKNYIQGRERFENKPFDQFFLRTISEIKSIDKAIVDSKVENENDENKLEQLRSKLIIDRFLKNRWAELPDNCNITAGLLINKHDPKQDKFSIVVVIDQKSETLNFPIPNSIDEINEIISFIGIADHPRFTKHPEGPIQFIFSP